MPNEAWLEPEDVEDVWIEAIDANGAHLGWIERLQADKLDMTPSTIETPERYLLDPWVRYHAQLAYERGLLSQGKDLNTVQVSLLASQLIKRREVEETLRTRRFEEDMLINNAPLFKAYQERKKQEHEGELDASIEERAPRSVEEFLATLAAFSEEDDAGSDKEQKSEGWLSSLLSEDDLNQMNGE